MLLCLYWNWRWKALGEYEEPAAGGAHLYAQHWGNWGSKTEASLKSAWATEQSSYLKKQKQSKTAAKKRELHSYQKSNSPGHK